MLVSKLVVSIWIYFLNIQPNLCNSFWCIRSGNVTGEKSHKIIRHLKNGLGYAFYNLSNSEI